MGKVKTKIQSIPAWAAVLSILVIGFCIYSNALHSEFHLDSAFYVTDPRLTENVGSISALWKTYTGRIIPTWTIGLNYALHGKEPFGYNLVSVGLHTITSILIFFLIRVMLQTPKIKDAPSCYTLHWMAFMGSLFFLCHPIQTQSVNYIVQRSVLMATLFYLLTLYLVIRARRKGSKLCYMMALVTAFLASFSKEIAFTLPVALILSEITFFGLKKNDLRWKVPYYTTFFLPFAVACFVIYLPRIQSGGVTQTFSAGTTNVTHWQYLLTQFSVLMTYLKLIAVPYPLNLDYDFVISKIFLEPRTLVSFGVLFSLFLFSLTIFKKNRLISFGILWFFLTLSVESSFIRIRDVIFEHRLYLPMFGVTVAAIAASHQIFKKLKSFVLFFTVVVLIFSVLTYQRNRVWQTDFALWQDVVKKSPKKGRGHNNLGNEYRKRGNLIKAREHLSRALALEPDKPVIIVSMGGLLADEEKLKESLKHYEYAAAISPDFGKPYYLEGLIHVGDILKKVGKYDEALRHYTKATEIMPTSKFAHYGAGITNMKLGRYDEAIQSLRQASELNPSYSKAQSGLGNVYTLKGEWGQALHHFKEAIRLNSDDESSKANSQIARQVKDQTQSEQLQFLKELKAESEAPEENVIPQYVKDYLNQI